MKQFILLLLVNFFTITALADEKNINSNDEDFRYSYNYSNGCSQVYDPYEKLNRKIFIFNAVLDYFFLRPVAVCYNRFANNYTKERVSSFLDNVTMPLTMVNYGLQVSYDQTMKSLWRFLINSTFGIGGLFDVAGKIGLTVKKQTFGNTLAYYGCPPGPYLVIPFVGSSNVRDMTDPLFTNSYLNPIMYVAGRKFEIVTSGMQMVDMRSKSLTFSNYIASSSTDPYIAVRSATHQNRESMVTYPKNFRCPKHN